MGDKLRKFVTGFAILLVLFGILIAFVDLNTFCLKKENADYIGVIFSLSGILLYFTALMYQIKEYKAQIKEFKKSVEAQTKSSSVLDEQKQLLIEQNITNMIFGFFNQFNEFRNRNNTQEAISNLLIHFRSFASQEWNTLKTNQRLNKRELNEAYAKVIQNTFSKVLRLSINFSIIKSYVQFVYNILYTIEQHKSNLPSTFSSAMFFCQLNNYESILIHLANLIQMDMPLNNKLTWNIPDTNDIIYLIQSNNSKIDYSELDSNLMTDFFRKLKQR